MNRTESFYRPNKWSTGHLLVEAASQTEQRITVADTPSSVGVSRYEADNCVHCHAAYGHTIQCPLLNRAVAEIRSALFSPTEADKIAAHGLGIIL
jgi:hypothetical protein